MPPTSPGCRRPSAQRETLISTGQVDMVVATYSITDARKEKVSFAGPYFIAGQDLLVRADDTSITGPDTLKGKKLCSVTGSTSAQKVKDAYPGVQLQEFATYSECLPRAGQQGGRRPHHRRHDPRRLRGAARVRRQVQGGRQAVLRGEVRHRPEEGRHRHLREGQRGDHQDDLGRLVAEGRSTPTSARPATSPAPATRRRRPPAPDARPRRTDAVRPRGRAASVVPADRKDAPMVEILEKYDVLAAFWMTIYLTFFAAIGSLVLGTVLAVMRVSPVGVLRGLGAFYVNTVRNTPLTLILLFCVLGVCTAAGAAGASDSPTSVRDNAIRWAIVGLSGLPRGLRLRGAAVGRQHGRPRPGRGGARHRPHLRPVACAR